MFGVCVDVNPLIFSHSQSSGESYQFCLLGGGVRWQRWSLNCLGPMIVTWMWHLPWMMAHPAAKGRDFWELPSINQCGVSGSRMGWSVKCWKGFWVRSTVRPQLCRRGPVVEDVGNKLAGLRGEHGENESWESRRKACRTCTLEGGRERKAQCDTSLGRRVENRLLKGHI